MQGLAYSQILKTQPSRGKRYYMYIYGLKMSSTSLRTTIQIYQPQIFANIEHSRPSRTPNKIQQHYLTNF